MTIETEAAEEPLKKSPSMEVNFSEHLIGIIAINCLLIMTIYVV